MPPFMITSESIANELVTELTGRFFRLQGSP